MSEVEICILPSLIGKDDMYLFVFNFKYKHNEEVYERFTILLENDYVRHCIRKNKM